MKRIVFILSALLAFTLISCDGINFSGPGNTNVSAPTVTHNSGGVTISPKPIDNIKYLNIFRYEVTQLDASATIVDNSTVNLCQIFPQEGWNSVLAYNDVYVDSQMSGGRYYRYFIRYATASGYVYSNDSGTIDTKDCSGSEIIGVQSITLASTPFEIEYDTKTYNMYAPATALNLTTTLNGLPSSGQFPDGTDFQLNIIIGNKDSTFLFPMQNVKIKDSGGTDVEKYQIALKASIPATFYDCELQIKGFVGQIEKEETNGGDESEESTKYTVYIWTEPLLLKDSAGTDNYKLIDVRESDPSAQELDDCRFEVPSSYESTEFGDYNTISRSIYSPVPEYLKLDFEL